MEKIAILHHAVITTWSNITMLGISPINHTSSISNFYDLQGTMETEEVRDRESDFPAVILELSEEEGANDSQSLYSREGIIQRGALIEEENEQGLTEEEQITVDEMTRRDKEVKNHEQTHAAILGRYAAGSPTYIYEVGPDGKAYAVGGSIVADAGSTSSPEESISKARALRMAATSVGNPSAADSTVASSASQMELEAQTDLFRFTQED